MLKHFSTHKILVKVFILIMVSLFSCNNKDKNSAKTKSPNNTVQDKKDSLQLKQLYDLSLAYNKQRDSTKFRDTNKRVIKLSIELKDSTILASAYRDLGFWFDGNNKVDSSYYNLLNAQQIYNKINDKENEGRVWNYIAYLQSTVKDYRGSEISAINALKALKAIKNQEIRIYDAYNILGSSTNALNEHNRAIEYYNKALAYQKKIKKSNIYNLYTLNNIGNAYSDKKDYKAAIKYYTQILNTDSLLIKEPRFYAKLLDNLAYTQFKKGDTLNIEKQLLKSLHLRDSLKDRSGLSISHYNLAEFYLQKKDTTKALYNAKKSEQYSLQSKNNKRLLQIYNLLTTVDSKNASHYAHKYIVLNDSLIAEERNLQEKFTRIQYETDEVLEQKEILEKQKQLLIFLVIGALLLAFAIFVIGNQYLKNQKLKFEQEQQVTNLETFNLMLAQKGKLVQVRQEEQQRISQELHDGVLGSLTGIGLILKAINNKADEKAINERLDLIKQLQETAEEIRTISHTLSASSSTKIQNFTNSISELLANTSKATNIKTDFTYDDNIDWDHLNADIKINLYRIIQEGIQNCVKYSKAKNIFLDLSMDESNLSVILSDNGVGFNLQKKKRGIGLKNIYSRSKKINADVKITSEIGNGTKINITIPLSENNTTII